MSSIYKQGEKEEEEEVAMVGALLSLLFVITLAFILVGKAWFDERKNYFQTKNELNHCQTNLINLANQYETLSKKCALDKRRLEEKYSKLLRAYKQRQEVPVFQADNECENLKLYIDWFIKQGDSSDETVIVNE